MTDRHPIDAAPRRRGRAPAAALTLVELLLGLAVTAVIAAAVGAMLFFASHGASTRDVTRSRMVANELAGMRVNMAIRSARAVLAEGDGYLVLWMADTRANNAPNLSELRRIERDDSTDRLLSYRAPDDLAEADDTLYDLGSTNFKIVTNSLKGSSEFPGEVWGTDVTGWTTDVDAVDPLDCRHVSYRITTTLEDVAQTMVGGAALRY